MWRFSFFQLDLNFTCCVRTMGDESLVGAAPTLCKVRRVATWCKSLPAFSPALTALSRPSSVTAIQTSAGSSVAAPARFATRSSKRGASLFAEAAAVMEIWVLGWREASWMALIASRELLPVNSRWPSTIIWGVKGDLPLNLATYSCWRNVHSEEEYKSSQPS